MRSMTSQVTNCDVLTRRYSIPLICGIFIAVIHSNFYPESYQYLFGPHNDDAAHFSFFPSFKLFGEYSLSLPFLINDSFMLFFFAFVLKHVIESVTPPNGNMYPLNRTIPSITSSIFGIITPIVFYISLISILETINPEQFSLQTLIHGCTIPMSTDIALSWTVATFIFNDHLNHKSSNINLHGTHSSISFLLLLAIFDDIIGLIVIGLFYFDQQLKFRPVYSLLVILTMFIAYISNKYFKIKQWWYYIFILGFISWIGFLLIGVHSAMALIPIMPFMIINNKQIQTLSPRHIQYDHIANDESELQHSSDYDLEHIIENDESSDEEITPSPATLKPYSLEMLDEFEKNICRFVEYGLFFFTYANAGVQFKDFGNVTLCIFFSALFGKIIGVSFGSYLVNKLFKIPLPFGMKLKHLPFIGFCASMNLTLSLFLSNVAFLNAKLKDEAKMGSLIAAGFAMCGGILYRIICRKVENKMRKPNNWQDL